MSAIKQALKAAFFRLLGKEPEAIVLHFWSGDAALAHRMSAEVLNLLPDLEAAVAKAAGRVEEEVLAARRRPDPPSLSGA